MFWFLGCLLVRVGSLFFFLGVWESGISDGEFDAVPYFFYCILRRPSCVPIRNFLCKGSFWRFKPMHEPGLTKAKGSSRFTKPLPFVNTEPHTCLPLPAHCLSIGKIERAHRALNGMQLKKILHSRSGKNLWAPKHYQNTISNFIKFFDMRQNYFLEYVPNAYINLCVDKAKQMANNRFVYDFKAGDKEAVQICAELFTRRCQSSTTNQYH